MPGKVKVKIVSGRNLPIMDRSNLTTDAYVEVKMGSTVYKTDVYRKSLNPVWNSEWFRFEMDDLELQDEPLQLRLMDHDTYSSNDAIGKVYLDLNPLLCNSSRGKDTSGKMISGWIPVYDTMHGLRGEVNLIVKVELFSDLNKFRQSSCGVRFFFTQSVPEGYIAHIMQGFVEELVVNDDPEYQWIDKIRTPRASNEARQFLFSKLSGEVQRKVGLKALELGGNAVIGYKQCFDLEGESGIVVRGIGTAAYLTKQYESQLSPTCGESLGLSREFTDIQVGYRTSSAFAKHYSRSLRRRGCPGRAPRLQRRSFRVTSSSDSMSTACINTHRHSKDDLEAIKKRCHGYAEELPSTFEGGGGDDDGCGASSGGAGATSHARHAEFQRSASFREDSLMRLVKFHLKKSLLTSSTQSIPPINYNELPSPRIGKNTKVSQVQKTRLLNSSLTVANSEPCIDAGLTTEGFTPIKRPSAYYTTATASTINTTAVPDSPLSRQKQNTPIKSVSLTTPPFIQSNTSPYRSRSTSRSPLIYSSNKSPRFHKDNNTNVLECPSTSSSFSPNRIIENVELESSHVFGVRSLDGRSPPLLPPSQTALASCMRMHHHRTNSDTITPAKSTLAILSQHAISRKMSKSVSNLNQSSVDIPIIIDTSHPHMPIIPILGYLDYESAGSNLDSNAEEDSTSDTSMKYLYGGGGGCVGGGGGGGLHEDIIPIHHKVHHKVSNAFRTKRDLEIESDTSKDFTKATTSSGNEACSVDNDELSPVSERDGFLMLRKKKGSRRKDRYSKSSLMKRASANFAERGYLLGGTERIREEVAKFFKRKKSSDDNTSCSSSATKNPSSTSATKKHTTKKSSPYREAKFFFRRRRTTSSSTTKHVPCETRPSMLFRSNSDSHSLGQTSLDSMPSVGSEPLFDDDEEDEEEDSTQEIIRTAATTSSGGGATTQMFYLNETSIIGGPNENVSSFEIPEVDEDSKENTPGDMSMSTVVDQPSFCASPNVLQLSRDKIVEIIKELGYSTESPLKLYISSMDALLVYDPSAAEDTTASGEGGDGDGDGSGFCGYDSKCASASLSVHSSPALKPANCRRGEYCAGCNSSYCCRHNDKRSGVAYQQHQVQVTPSRSPRGMSSRPVGTTGTGTALSSFSTIDSSTRLGETGTSDSFSTSASESAKSSFSILNQAMMSAGSRGNDKDRDKETKKYYKSGHVSYYHPVVEEGDGSGKGSIKLYRARASSCSDENNEDILEVVTTSRQVDDSGRGMAGNESDDGNVDHGKSCDVQMAIAGCTRSPIPEELLFDRTTPTQMPTSNHPASVVGGGGGGNLNLTSLTAALGGSGTSNSCTATTPIPNSANANNYVTNNNSTTNNNNIVVLRQTGGGHIVAHHQGDSSASSNSNNITSTTITNASTNNNDMSGGGGDDEVSKKLVNTSISQPSEESKSATAINGAGNTTVTCLDETGKESSSLSSPCPPRHPNCEPQNLHYHHNQQQNGHSNHHRHPLYHQAACKDALNTVGGGFSQETSVDVHEGSSGNENVEYVQESKYSGVPRTPNIVSHHGLSRVTSVGPQYLQHNHSNMTTTILTTGTGTAPVVVGGGGALHRRSSESDLSTPPKANAVSMSTHMRGFPTTSGLKPGITTTIDQYGLMEYPFITISQFPPGFLTHIGGTVTARSVKLLERISNLDEPESRDAWWNEIRMEIRAHCRAFGCTVVVGYEEHTTMCDDVCVLSASGTAAIAATTIGLKNVELLTVSTKQGTTNPVIADTPCPGRGVEKDRSVLPKPDSVINNATGNGALKHLLVTPSKLRHDSDHDPNCSMLHIPSNPAGLPFPVKMARCHVCRKGRVPDVLIVTVDVPPCLHITGKGTLVQAQVFRPKKDCKGEISAKEVSDSLPFLEYELHRRLINKLKVKGMNAIFGLKVQICLGDKLMVAVATGTAMYVTALPPPGVPIITAGNLKTDAQKVLQYQKVVQDAYDRNRQHYDLKTISIPTSGRQSGSSGEESDDDENTDGHSSNKDTYILEVDDAEDIDIISMLIDPNPTSAFLMNNIDYLHGYEEHHVSNQQMFTQVWRCRIPTLSLRQFTAYFERLIRAVCFKLRKMMPCVLSKLQFRVELPEPDEMQISIIGLALGMNDQPKIAVGDKLIDVKSGSVLSVAKEDGGELMFTLEEDGSGGGSITGTSGASGSGQQATGARTSELSLSNNEAVKELRGTPPPGILVPVMVTSSSTATPLPAAHAPQLSKCISGDSTAGNLASSPSAILPGHGVNYSFRGGSSHIQQTISLSRSGSKVIPKSALPYIPKAKFIVEITPLAYIPGARIDKYLGNLNFFFIRETTSIRENGGLSGFVHNFVAEILAIVRAHVAALGGNAMVSYFMTELALLHNPHKNQGQCLINVGGDVVLIVHPSSIPDDGQLNS